MVAGTGRLRHNCQEFCEPSRSSETCVAFCFGLEALGTVVPNHRAEAMHRLGALDSFPRNILETPGGTDSDARYWWAAEGKVARCMKEPSQAASLASGLIPTDLQTASHVSHFL